MVGSVYIIAVRALIEDSEGRILLIKRSSNSKTNPSTWELPGGKVGAGESIEEALKREVKEETGLEITPHQVVGVAEQKFPVINAIHIIMRCGAGGEVELSHEHEGFAWVEPGDIGSYQLADWLKDFMEKNLNQGTVEEDSGLKRVIGLMKGFRR